MKTNLHITQHAQRVALHNEIHARPPEAMEAPLAISHIVMLCTANERQASREHVAALLRDHHLPPPDATLNHLRAELGGFRLRWELHTEFVTYTFVRAIEGVEGKDSERIRAQNAQTAIDAVPQDWIAHLPGSALVNLHFWCLPVNSFDSPNSFDNSALVKQLLSEETLVGSKVADGSCEVYTDFAIQADGFSRMVMLASKLAPRRLGRLVQRLLEIETYRMAALLGLPAAREAGSSLAYAERELAELAEAIRSADRNEEPVLLDRLTKLAGQVESQYAATHSRFSASSAYFELVDERIADINESRLGELQTIREFMDRRLTPARSTCEWATRRQDALSQRVSRISNLLRTRVEIEQQQSSQALLSTMNSRQDLQMKMQSTVEGLSIAAITYYIAGLVSYLAKAAQKLGWPLSVEITTAIAIPFVAIGIWWALRRLHQRVFKS
jgi:uncharacterized membrane-anchored protein